MELLCEYCNKPFAAKRNDALYCGSACRQLAYVLRKAQNNPITKGLNHPGNNYPSTQLNVTGEEKEPSIQIIPGIDYPSTRKEQEPLGENEITVNTDKEGIKELDEPKDDGPIVYSSAFIRDLKALVTKRDNIDYFMEDSDLDCDWVNLRYRCLVESLLTLSEMESVNLDDLKEICNAFTGMIQSSGYEHLPEYYPYEKDIKTLWQTLKKLCSEADEEQPLNFKLKRSTRLNLIVTRWELAHFVRKESFNQLNFEE